MMSGMTWEHTDAAKVALGRDERICDGCNMRVAALLAAAAVFLLMALGCSSNSETDSSLWQSGYVDGFKTGIKLSCGNAGDAQLAIQDKPDAYRRAYDEGYKTAQAQVASYKATLGDVIGAGSQQDPCQQTSGPDTIPNLP